MAAPAKPGKPKNLAVTASGKDLKESWARGAGVSDYLVRAVVTEGDGATKAATVTVIPQSVTGVPGPAATATYPSAKPKPKG